MEIIQSTEVNTAKDVNIFSKYMEIKQKNETFKAHMYNQFWKQTSTSQHILLSAFESGKGRMQLAFLQAQVPFPFPFMQIRFTL